MTTLRSGSATDVGRVRTTNQDVALEDPDLFAVADGMGGHVGGDVAARVAVDSLRAAFQRQPTVEGLRRAVAEANRAVWSHGQAESGLRGMGTTLTATALVEEPDGRQVIALANVGDSRAYVFSRGQVIQVTADHSVAEEKVRQGQLTEAEAAVHPHRHILTRALGVSSDVDVDLWELHLHDGDRILLCSDGLTDEIGPDQIGEILTSVADPKAAARSLVDAALEHGGSDNVTCVVIDVAGTEPSEAEVAGAEPSALGGDPGSVPSGEAAAGRAGSRAQSGRGDAIAAGGDGDATGVLRAVGGSTATASRASRRRASRAATSAATATGAATAPVTTATGRPPAAPTVSSDPEPARDPLRDNGAGGSISGARLQAAELRRLRPSGDVRGHRRRSGVSPRLVTVRSVLFILLLAAVVAAAYAAMRWYAMSNWYVTVDRGHLAVYQGRPGGFLWFKPQLVDETPVTTTEVLPYTVPHDRTEPSLAAAKRYVRNLHEEYLATRRLSTGGTPATTSSAGAASTARSTPAASGGTTPTTALALFPPVTAWS